MTDAADLLARYRAVPFDESLAGDDPLPLFETWMADAEREDCAQPNAMAIATVDNDGTPGVRNVLLRGLDQRGLVFYTNERSRKGRALAHDARIEALFSWLELDRQVRVTGRATHAAPQESDAYFGSRDRLSQLGAHASKQSERLADRDELVQRVAELERRFDGREVPRPPHWGGFRISPIAWEFWQGREGRLHDRLRFVKDRRTWHLERLHP
ncbi:MAG: pyridoxamine 5'-phosphate oxidase [Actinomycetota bacterium]